MICTSEPNGFLCPRCGVMVNELTYPGYCSYCVCDLDEEDRFYEEQRRQQEHWNSLTDAERDFMIREAMK